MQKDVDLYAFGPRAGNIAATRRRAFCVLKPPASADVSFTP